MMPEATASRTDRNRRLPLMALTLRGNGDAASARVPKITEAGTGNIDGLMPPISHAASKAVRTETNVLSRTLARCDPHRPVLKPSYCIRDRIALGATNAN